MKALTLIQLWHLNAKEFEPYENYRGNVSKWAYFLNQPFKPELITELFEGWKHPNEYEYFCGSSYVGFILTNKAYYIIGTTQTIDGLRKEPERMFTPRTLDDFINDCQRAGIELNWREK